MLDIEKISHHYDADLILDQVSLRLTRGEIGCVLGPSGCGKTTLLRCVAGFESISDGRISIDGVVVDDREKHVPAQNRHVGMVFQDYALLPHLSSVQNVLFGLHALPKEEATERAYAALSQVGLSDFADRYPHELSGGQQQRVAIARALAPKPILLLMDEPFSNIDAAMRAELGSEISDLLRANDITALIATHDHHDAFSLADTVGVMQKGKLVQWDAAYNVYHQPSDPFVANFVGRGVWLDGNVLSDNEIQIEPGVARGTMTRSFPAGSNVKLFLRPDDIVHDDESTLQAKVVRRNFRGSDFIYELELPSGLTLLSLVPSHHDHAPGEMIGIRLETDHMVVFPGDD